MFGAAIEFPNLGITIEKLNKTFSVFGVEIAFYGLIIGIGMIAGVLLVLHEAKITNQNADNYIDLALFAIIFGVIGARMYYVAFKWDYYSAHPEKILMIKEGGLAIYGGIIAGIITCIVYSRVKKLSLWQIMDTACLGLLVGQIFGRWGNFFNREAFGGDSDGLFAMKIDTMDKNVYVDVPRGVSFVDDAGRYIQVQPTFLYESCWNLMLLILIMIFKKKKKYNGEMILWYLLGYGVGRSVIEGMRTDQLLLPVVGFPVSQVLSIVLAVGAGGVLIYNRGKISKGKKVVMPEFSTKEKKVDID